MGTDAEYQAAVFDTYPTLLRKTLLWPTLGNHDGGSANSGTQTGAYYDIFTLPTQGEAGGMASGTEAYYSFDYANIHFIVLDSEGSDLIAGRADADLARGRSRARRCRTGSSPSGTIRPTPRARTTPTYSTRAAG